MTRPSLAPAPALGLGKAAPCGCRKVPPPGEDFEFIRGRGRPGPGRRRGVVHVAAWHDETCTWLARGRTMPEIIAIQRISLQCGLVISRNLGREGEPGFAQRVSAGSFRDEEFCRPCVTGLGDYAHLVFARPQPDDCAACGGSRDECEDARPRGRQCCSECEHPGA